MANYENEEMHDDGARIRGVALAVGKTKAGRKGGAILHNDCLWDCLMKGFEKVKTPSVLKTPEKFTEWLKVGRNDKMALTE